MEEYKLAIRGGQIVDEFYNDLSQAIDAASKLTIEVNKVVQVYRLVGETVRQAGWLSK